MSTKGKKFFLDEFKKDTRTFIQGAAKDALGFDLPDQIADQLAAKFQTFFSGIIEEFSSTQPNQGGNQGGRVVRLDQRRGQAGGSRALEGRRGLFAELPLMVPCRVFDGELVLDLEQFDFWQELEVLLQEWQEDQSVSIKVYTKDGAGQAYELESNEVDVTVNIGELYNDRDNKPDHRGGARRSGRSRSSR